MALLICIFSHSGSESESTTSILTLKKQKVELENRNSPAGNCHNSRPISFQVTFAWYSSSFLDSFMVKPILSVSSSGTSSSSLTSRALLPLSLLGGKFLNSCHMFLIALPWRSIGTNGNEIVFSASSLSRRLSLLTRQVDCHSVWYTAT